jgi:hypothetical protein
MDSEKDEMGISGSSPPCTAHVCVCVCVRRKMAEYPIVITPLGRSRRINELARRRRRHFCPSAFNYKYQSWFGPRPRRIHTGGGMSLPNNPCALDCSATAACTHIGRLSDALKIVFRLRPSLHHPRTILTATAHLISLYGPSVLCHDYF